MTGHTGESARPVTLSQPTSQPTGHLQRSPWVLVQPLLVVALLLFLPTAPAKEETKASEAVETVEAIETKESPEAVETAEPLETEEDADAVEDDLPSEEREAIEAAVARPVPADPVQIFGWREKIRLQDLEQEFHAKLDSGALTSSIHAEDIELFERDGAKWVRFIATSPREENAKRVPVEAPLVRYARIKEVGGESTRREVVRLHIRIGKRSLRGEFTLANRSNMLVPILIGRSMLKELGWVDPARTYLAEQEILR